MWGSLIRKKLRLRSMTVSEQSCSKVTGWKISMSSLHYCGFSRNWKRTNFHWSIFSSDPVIELRMWLDRHKTLHRVSNEYHIPMHECINTLYDPQLNTCLNLKVKDLMYLTGTLLFLSIFSSNSQIKNLLQILKMLNAFQFIGENLSVFNDFYTPHFWELSICILKKHQVRHE